MALSSAHGSLSRRLLRLSGVVLVLTALAACDEPVPEGGGTPIVRFEAGPGGDGATIDTVTVTGLNRSELRELRRGDLSTTAWRLLLPVHVGDISDGRPSLLGDYRIDGDRVRFTPRFPFERGRTYQARWLDPASGREMASASVRLDPVLGGAAPTVIGVYPSASELPENLLRFYVLFSAPMSREEAASHIRLVGPDGPIERPFVAPEHELWNDSRDRLTLILDPGRIKRGVGPNLERGPVLRAGDSYRLEIGAGWRDGQGRELATEGAKQFEVVAADRVEPRPAEWELRPPTGPAGAVELRFAEPLDYAMLQSAFRVETATGSPIAGNVRVGGDERSWVFTPDLPWPESEGRLVVDPALEDPSGNRVGRRFEEAVRAAVGQPESEPLVLPFSVGREVPSQDSGQL